MSDEEIIVQKAFVVIFGGIGFLPYDLPSISEDFPISKLESTPNKEINPDTYKAISHDLITALKKHPNVFDLTV